MPGVIHPWRHVDAQRIESLVIGKHSVEMRWWASQSLILASASLAVSFIQPAHWMTDDHRWSDLSLKWSHVPFGG